MKRQNADSNEILNAKLRYKLPDKDTSNLLEVPVTDGGADFESASEDFRFAAAVASFGMLLRNSEYKGSSSFAGVRAMAENAQGNNRGGYRSEFLTLVDQAAHDLGTRRTQTSSVSSARCSCLNDTLKKFVIAAAGQQLWSNYELYDRAPGGPRATRPGLGLCSRLKRRNSDRRGRFTRTRLYALKAHSMVAPGRETSDCVAVSIRLGEVGRGIPAEPHTAVNLRLCGTHRPTHLRRSDQ